MGVVALDHVQIAMPPGREQEAREFYQGILGISEVPKPIELSGRGGAWFESGQIKIHLGIEDEFRPARKAHPAFLVSDLNQMLTLLINNGYSVTEDKSLSKVQRAFTQDPFGNRVELIQYESGNRT
jgi:catechol 2,3-dioxygenase-like lactoylglutathione lyase family enzyme